MDGSACGKCFEERNVTVGLIGNVEKKKKIVVDTANSAFECMSSHYQDPIGNSKSLSRIPTLRYIPFS